MDRTVLRVREGGKGGKGGDLVVRFAMRIGEGPGGELQRCCLEQGKRLGSCRVNLRGRSSTELLMC